MGLIRKKRSLDLCRIPSWHVQTSLSYSRMMFILTLTSLTSTSSLYTRWQRTVPSNPPHRSGLTHSQTATSRTTLQAPCFASKPPSPTSPSPRSNRPSPNTSSPSNPTSPTPNTPPLTLAHTPSSHPRSPPSSNAASNLAPRTPPSRTGSQTGGTRSRTWLTATRSSCS